MSGDRKTNKPMNSIERYCDLQKVAPELFETKSSDGVILLLEPDSILMAQNAARLRLESNGLSSDYATVGVVYEDQYIYVLRDAVKFPDGTLGTYIRMIHKTYDHAGVVVIPTNLSGIYLIRHFRHATRRWHWEVPRGFASSSDPASTVISELEEEIGAKTNEIRRLGSFYPDSGLMSSVVHAYSASVEVGDTVDKSEPISEIRHVNWTELSEMIANGAIDDGFTLSSIALLTNAEISDRTKR